MLLLSFFALSLAAGAADAADDVFVFIPVDRQSPDYVELQSMKRSLFREFERDNSIVGELSSRNFAVDISRNFSRSPELMELTLRDTVRRNNAPQEYRRSEESRFFAAIDVGAMARANSLGRSFEPEAAVREIRPNTIYSPPGRGWFSTDYPEINANLRCDWSENLRLKTALQEQTALEREAALEEEFRRQKDPIDLQPPNREEERGQTVRTNETDGTALESSDGLHQSLRVAGIPCLITYYCDDIDAPCSNEILQDIVSRVRLVSGGE